MEGFLSINWDKAVDESSFFFSKEEFEKSSAAYHKLHGIPQSPWPCEEHLLAGATASSNVNDKKWNPSNLKREVVDGVGGKGKLLRIHLPQPFPQQSILNVIEQKDYLYAIIRIMKAFMTGLPAEPADVMCVKEMQKKLKDEIQEFQKFAYTIMEKNPSSYSSLNTGIAKYVNDAWKSELAHVSLEHPRFYKLIGNVTLIPKECINSMDMVLEQTLLELGSVPYQIFPRLNTLIKLTRGHKAMSKRFPPTKCEDDLISKDPNAHKLASKYDVDIVVSSNTLCALAGNVGPLFRRAWDIPFTVKELTIGGAIKKVIFVDEPLPPVEMSAIEKNLYFNRVAIKHDFTTAHLSRVYTYPGSSSSSKIGELRSSNVSAKTCKESPYDNNEAMDEDHLYNVLARPEASELKQDEVPSSILEHLNVTEPSTLSIGETKNVIETKKNIEQTFIESSDSDSSESSQLVIDTDCSSPEKKKRKNEYKKTTPQKDSARPTSEKAHSSDMASDSERLSPPKTAQKDEKTLNKQSQNNSAQSSASSNLLNVILQDQEKMMKSSRNQTSKNVRQPNFEAENPKDFKSPRQNQNLTYRIWSLKANEKSLRILVRSSVDTAIVSLSGELKTFLMVPKTEYQPWFGAESFGPQEINEQWMNLHLRPECNMLRVRLDAYTGDFLMVETKDKACFEIETTFKYGEQFKPSNCLQNLWAIFSSLHETNFAEGSYLLRHGFHDGICVQVWQSTNQESSSLDLHQVYASVDTTANAVRDIKDNWMALEPCVVLPIQRALNRPPLTFEPTTEFKKGSFKKKPGSKKKNPKKVQ